MHTSSPTEGIPDGVVQAVRQAGKVYEQLQISRYPTTASPHLTTLEVAVPSLIMRTKTVLPKTDREEGEEGGEGAVNTRQVSPSEWSELYRRCVEELPDTQAKQLWGFVSIVLTLLEQGRAGEGVNASECIVAWHNHFSTELAHLPELMLKLQLSSPANMSEDEVATLGSGVLDGIEAAFRTGHFDTAAELMDSLVRFLHRSSATLLLTAEVESALANVKRLLAVGFHDSDTFQRCWIEPANELLLESRNVLSALPSQGANSSAMSSVDHLVCDLCGTCIDILVLITQDATCLVRRCLESNRTAVDFLVAVCAIMEPYAELSTVAAIYAEYVDHWSSNENRKSGDHWMDLAVLAVVKCETLADVVEAMAEVTAIAEAAAQCGDAAEGWGGAGGPSHRDAREVDEDEMSDADDAASDTVALEELAAAGAAAGACGEPGPTRRFILASMAAHVADLCAPVAVAAEDVRLTFTRNDLVEAYAALFAFDSRTWRVAGMYACYSPLLNPLFVRRVVGGAVQWAAESEAAYRSLQAFLRSSWCPDSPLQVAVRNRLEATLPGCVAVRQWWAATAFYYAETYRDVHQRMIETLRDRQEWARAAWLAVVAEQTGSLQLRLRQLLQGADALTNAEVLAVGSAVRCQFIPLEGCAAGELVRYLCTASALSAYQNSATAAEAALAAQGSSSAGPSTAHVVEAVVACLGAIETAIRFADECDVMLHPRSTFALVEHGASLLLTLRQLMVDPVTGDTTASMSVTSGSLPLLVEAYELARIHFGQSDATLARRSLVLAEQLARVHQVCI